MNTVWVLTVKHAGEAEDEILVYEKEVSATIALFRYVRYWWPLMVGEDVPMPGSARTAILQYFVFALPSGEEYTLVECFVNP